MASVPRLIPGPGISTSYNNGTAQHEPTCHPQEKTVATVLFSIAALGIMGNLALIILVALKKPLKRYRRSWSQGLLLHQGVVDLARSLLLIPLGISVVVCERLSQCSIIDTGFLLLVSVSSVNMLTTLINDAPIFPENEQLGSISAAVAGAQRLRNDQSWLELSAAQMDMADGNSDSPYCIFFGIFIIWFASLTINLGPTFLSGGLSSTDGGHIDVCPMIYRPARHYVLNVLWILVNLMCIGLMAIHLRKLWRDIVKSNLEAVRLASLVTTMIPVQSEAGERDQRHLHGYIQRLEQEGLARVKMFVIILFAYILFWGPLFTVTLLKPGVDSSFAYELTLNIAFVHCFINPILFMIMNREPAYGVEPLEPSEIDEPGGRNHRLAQGHRRPDRQTSCCGCFEFADEDSNDQLPPMSRVSVPTPPPPIELPPPQLIHQNSADRYSDARSEVMGHGGRSLMSDSVAQVDSSQPDTPMSSLSHMPIGPAGGGAHHQSANRFGTAYHTSSRI